MHTVSSKCPFFSFNFLRNLILQLVDGMSQWGSPHERWNRIHSIRIPDPHSMWSCVSSTRHADYSHCTARLDFTHTFIALSSDPDGGRVEAKWSSDADPQSALDPDPRSCVESPYVIHPMKCACSVSEFVKELMIARHVSVDVMQCTNTDLF